MNQLPQAEKPTSQSEKPIRIGDQLLSQTNKLGRVSAETLGVVKAIADVIVPTDGEEESPVLEALNQVSRLLQNGQDLLESINHRLTVLEERAPS